MVELMFETQISVKMMQEIFLADINKRTCVRLQHMRSSNTFQAMMKLFEIPKKVEALRLVESFHALMTFTNLHDTYFCVRTILDLLLLSFLLLVDLPI